MTKWMQSMEEKLIDFFNNQGKYILGGIGIGVLTYFMMMSLNLVNDVDGIWHLSNFIAGDWEISLGRGLQRYADRARFGIVSDSFNTILTICLFSIANAIILMKFQPDGVFHKVLFITVMIANPIVCNSLTYSYMSVNFGLAYFFSVIAFGCLRSNGENPKKCLPGMVGAAFFLSISMAFYQAYICVTCVLAVFYMIKLLLEGRKIKEVLQYGGLCMGTVVTGGLLYFFITKALLFRADIQLASYKGAAGMNPLLMLKVLPESLRQCYIQFGDFIWTRKAFSDLEFMNVVLLGLCAVYLLAGGIQFVKLWKQHVISALLFVILLGVLPIAGCVVLLIAVGNSMTGLMSMGVLMCMVMPGIVIPGEGNAGFWMKRAYLLVLLAFVWFQLSAVENDQLALKEGKTATITLSENIIAQLYNKGYLEEYQVVAFVGRPANNHRFAQSTAYQMANPYARFGSWSTEARNNRVSWNGIISNFLGVNLSICSETDYQQIIAMEQVAAMPEFPMEGSVCVINDIIVVKVSDLY